MEFIIAILATYSITLMLTELDGPTGVFARMRKLQAFQMLKCFPCTSIYVGIIIALYPADGPLEWVLTSLALAGAATFLDRFSG